MEYQVPGTVRVGTRSPLCRGSILHNRPYVARIILILHVFVLIESNLVLLYRPTYINTYITLSTIDNSLT